MLLYLKHCYIVWMCLHSSKQPWRYGHLANVKCTFLLLQWSNFSTKEALQVLLGEKNKELFEYVLEEFGHRTSLASRTEKEHLFEKKNKKNTVPPRLVKMNYFTSLAVTVFQILIYWLLSCSLVGKYFMQQHWERMARWAALYSGSHQQKHKNSLHKLFAMTTAATRISEPKRKVVHDSVPQKGVVVVGL